MKPFVLEVFWADPCAFFTFSASNSWGRLRLSLNVWPDVVRHVSPAGTVAEGAPIIPISAQLKYNIEVVCEYIVKKIPVPIRDFTSEPRLIGKKEKNNTQVASSLLSLTVLFCLFLNETPWTFSVFQSSDRSTWTSPAVKWMTWKEVWQEEVSWRVCSRWEFVFLFL